MKRAFAFVLLAGWFAVRPSPALVLIGGDLPANRLPPPNGAPWGHIAALSSGGTGVYLGKRLILTAGHVNFPATASLNGVLYNTDPAFGTGGAMTIDGEDLKIIRIIADPGLAKLPLILPTDNDLAKKCTIIGGGLGNGTEIPDQGWNWGTVGALRWGMNVTLATIGTDEGHPRLLTAFDFAFGANEACLANGDSGCALFQRFSGVWKLAGIGTNTDTPGKALYDQDLNTPGRQPDRCYFVRIRDHRDAIKAIMRATAP